jgi:hypothetical protein
MEIEATMELSITATPRPDIEIAEGMDEALRVFEANAIELASLSFVNPRLLRSWVGPDRDGVVKMRVTLEVDSMRSAD